MIGLLATAFADDQLVDAGFRAPDDLPLFRSAGHGVGKGNAKGDDCPGAVAAALQALAHGHRVLALDGDGRLECKQRKAGDAVSASLVEVSGWWVEPGVGAPVAAARQLALAKVVAKLLPEDAPLVLEPGPTGAWLTWPTVVAEAPPTLPEPADRAVHAWQTWVSEWVPAWPTLLGALPELAGGRLEIAWPADKAKNGTLRFDVPKELAARWLAGDLGDDVLVAGCAIGWSPDPRKVPFQPLQVDVEAGPTRTPVTAPEPRVDVKPEDLEGLEDEVP